MDAVISNVRAAHAAERSKRPKAPYRGRPGRLLRSAACAARTRWPQTLSAYLPPPRLDEVVCRAMNQPLEDQGVRRFAAGVSFPRYTYVPGRFPHPTSDPAGHSYGVL